MAHNDTAPTPLRKRVVAVTPTYDERDNIADLIAVILAQQQEIGSFDLHVLVADSHSTDGTLAIVQALADESAKIHLLDVQQRGIGIGLYHGFRHAIDVLGAEVLVEIDSDFQHNPEDIPRFLREIAKGYDVVVGSRFAARDGLKAIPFYRRVLSVGANQLIRIMLGLREIEEITTSYRAFTREAFLKIDPASVPWYDQSFLAVPVFLVRMLESGASVQEIPITMHPRLRGYSKMIYWKYVRDIFWFALKSRIAIILGKFSRD